MPRGELTLEAEESLLSPGEAGHDAAGWSSQDSDGPLDSTRSILKPGVGPVRANRTACKRCRTRDIRTRGAEPGYMAQAGARRTRAIRTRGAESAQG